MTQFTKWFIKSNISIPKLGAIIGNGKLLWEGAQYQRAYRMANGKITPKKNDILKIYKATGVDANDIFEVK